MKTLWQLTLITLLTLCGLVLFSPAAPVHAQDGDCGELIDDLRLATSDAACRTINTNWACYGSTQADATPGYARFDRPRDRERLTVLNSISTFSPRGAGLALLNAYPQRVKMIVFGASTLEPVGPNSFVLNASGDALLCENTPSGLVVRTERNESGLVTVNGVDIELGSTAFVTTRLGGALGRIAYYSDVEGNWDLYTMDASGGDVRRLTSFEGDNLHGTWSPDGSQLVFRSNRNGNYDIYTMRADGTGVVQLTSDRSDDDHPTWSPDGRWIAYDSDRDGDREIYIMRADGSGRRQLTRNGTDDRWPVWSPDGSLIAFYSNRDGDREIFVMTADGGDVRQLTSNRADDRYPDWSPDGSRLAFASNRDGDWEVYVMDAAGRNVRQLTRNTGVTDWGPTWAPDGGQIGFASDRDGDNEIYVMNADGSDPRPLTDNFGADEMPMWQPPSAVRAAGGESMEVTNLEGSVTVTIPGRESQFVPEGQRVQVIYAGGEPIDITPPAEAEVYVSPVLRWLTDDPEGLASVNDPNGPDQPEYMRCGAVVEYGAQIYDSISVQGQECLYEFYGQAGDTVTIDMAADSYSDLDSWLDLRGPDGPILISDDDSAGDLNARIGNYALPQEGTYTIVARAAGDETTGSFELALNLAQNELPDLTTSIDNFDVECDADYCWLTVDFTVWNYGYGDANGAFDVTVSGDAVPAQVVTFDGLAAGSSRSESVRLGPGGNCYNPDCTVNVFVDPSGAIPETDDANNEDTRTTIG